MNNDFNITLVNQQCSKSCVIACMAMVAGVSFEEAYKSIEDIAEPPLSDMPTRIGLTRLGVACFSDTIILWKGEVYLLDVPSLNLLGSMHCIVVDTRSDEYGIYDPNYGIPGKKYYSSWDDIKGFGTAMRVMRIK